MNSLYRARSISIGTGSKNKNLLQVSLQLLKNLIIFKIHSSCIDTLSSARLPLVKSPLEVGFRNTVESPFLRSLNRLDGIEPMFRLKDLSPHL